MSSSRSSGIELVTLGLRPPTWQILYKIGKTSTTINKNLDDIDCINYVCSPEDAKVYKTDNLDFLVL